MIHFKTAAFATALAFGAVQATASTSPIDTSAYDPLSMVEILNTTGFADFSGADFGDVFQVLDDAGASFWIGAQSTDAAGVFSFDGSFVGGTDVLDVTGASGSAFGAGSFSAFFEGGGFGYLVSFASDNSTLDFGDTSTDVVGELGTVTVSRYAAPAAVPLPAGLPLMVAGLGCIGLVARRRTA